MRILRVIPMAIILFGLAFASSWSRGYRSDVAYVTLPDRSVLTAQVADSEEERRVGLSGRAEPLGENEAMLFVLDGPSRPAFWMTDMSFPIDIVWIDGGQIVGIERDVPVPDPWQSTIPTYSPPRPVDRVLEANAGFAAAHGLAEGDLLDIREP